MLNYSRPLLIKRSANRYCENAHIEDPSPKPNVLFNQFTMIQFTIDNAKIQIQSPKTHSTDLRARPRVPDVPFVPSVPFVPDVRDVSGVSDVRGVRDVSNVRGVSANARCQQKTEHQQMRISVSEARASARAYRPTRSSEFSKAGTESPRRFTRFKCFKCFRRFICFIRFKRFRNIWPLQKMKHPDPNIGTRVPDLK